VRALVCTQTVRERRRPTVLFIYFSFSFIFIISFSETFTFLRLVLVSCLTSPKSITTYGGGDGDDDHRLPFDIFYSLLFSFPAFFNFFNVNFRQNLAMRIEAAAARLWQQHGARI